MKSNRICFICYILLFNISFSQKENIDSLRNSYVDYFKSPRETVYLHSNKTVYFDGEELWFTAYIYNRKTGLPLTETTNLYCGIYNSQGKQQIRKLFHVKNGVAQGNFKISSEFGSGEFFIKAYTNWMRNFKEDDSFIQQFTILGKEIESGVSESNKEEKELYDIKILPEGGHLVSGTTNTIGFRVTDQQGNGISVKNGKVLNDYKEIETNNIKSNVYGIGKFSLKHQKGSKYHVEFELFNGTTITGPIPDAEEIGISISVNSLLNDKIVISIQTNTQSLPYFQGKQFYIAIHRDGLISLSTFLFDKNEKTIQLPKRELWPGINIITFFDEKLNPIIERLVFNETRMKLVDELNMKFDNKNTSKDSIKFKINLFSKIKTPTRLSMSILPAETLANNPNKSIVSSFLLEPYIKSEIQNPRHYFNNFDRKKLFELDLLLITQGWSKYDWVNIFNNPPQILFAFERGISLMGKVKNAEYGQNNKIAAFQKKVEKMRITDIDSNKDFQFDKLYFIKGDSINFWLLDNKDKKRKPVIDLTFSPTIKEDSVIPPKLYLLQNPLDSTSEQVLDFGMITEGNVINLENVIVTEKRIENKLTRNTRLTVGVFESVKISEKEVKKFPVLSRFIRSLGYKVFPNPVNNTVFIAAKNPMGKPPVVYLNDLRLQDQLTDFQLNSIDEIYYEHFGTDRSNGGTIYIYSKFGSFIGQKSVENFTRFMATEGFSRPKTYYNPKYSSYKNKGFLDYGALHWEHAVNIDTNGQAEIVFPNYDVNEVKVFIEGMSADGSLISITESVQLN